MTTWVHGRILVAGFPATDHEPWLVELGDALARLGVAWRLTAESRRRVAGLRGTTGRSRELLDELWVSTVELTDGGRGRQPEAWWVLERLRQVAPGLAWRVALEEAVAPAVAWEGPLGVTA